MIFQTVRFLSQDCATTPPAGLSSGPRAVLPLMILTRAIRSVVKRTPRKDSVPSVGEHVVPDPHGALKMPRELPWVSKNCRLELPARSTSLKTAPNPLTVAGVVPALSGTENVPSVIVLPSGAKSRF